MKPLDPEYGDRERCNHIATIHGRDEAVRCQWPMYHNGLHFWNGWEWHSHSAYCEYRVPVDLVYSTLPFSMCRHCDKPIEYLNNRWFFSNTSDDLCGISAGPHEPKDAPPNIQVTAWKVKPKRRSAAAIAIFGDH